MVCLQKIYLILQLLILFHRLQLNTKENVVTTCCFLQCKKLDFTIKSRLNISRKYFIHDVFILCKTYFLMFDSTFSAKKSRGKWSISIFHILIHYSTPYFWPWNMPYTRQGSIDTHEYWWIYTKWLYMIIESEYWSLYSQAKSLFSRKPFVFLWLYSQVVTD